MEPYPGALGLCLDRYHLRRNAAAGYARASGARTDFRVLVAGNFGLILVNRSFKTSVVVALMRPDVALWLIFGITVLLLGMTLAIRAARELFRFGPLHLDDLLLVAVCGALTVLLLESIKAVSRSLRLSLA